MVFCVDTLDILKDLCLSGTIGLVTIKKLVILKKLKKPLKKIELGEIDKKVFV